MGTTPTLGRPHLPVVFQHAAPVPPRVSGVVQEHIQRPQHPALYRPRHVRPADETLEPPPAPQRRGEVVEVLVAAGTPPVAVGPHSGSDLFARGLKGKTLHPASR
jgi:hypothetical protein